MKSFPSIFVSHGAPMLIQHPGPAHDFLQQLGYTLERPKAILCITAHWETKHTTVSATPTPETIHTGRFVDEILRLRYPALGDPALAARVAYLLTQSGLECTIDAHRGFDRGTWIPLILMYPEVSIPVVQLSVQPQLNPLYHLQLGQALETLRHEGVLIVGSGSATHNLKAMSHEPNDERVFDWVVEFDHWLSKAVCNRDIEVLLKYRQLAPHVNRNHPTPEHLLPLFVAMGAGGVRMQPRQIHSSYTYGVLSMSAFSFS